jgi:hypothetical protein
LYVYSACLCGLFTQPNLPGFVYVVVDPSQMVLPGRSDRQPPVISPRLHVRTVQADPLPVLLEVAIVHAALAACGPVAGALQRLPVVRPSLASP